jgi:hypothetical protein
MFEPSFDLKTTVTTKVKYSDFGQRYDMFKTRITLAMSVTSYEQFRNAIYSIPPQYENNSYFYPISFETSEQLFIPGQNIQSGICEFVSEKQLGFYDFKMNWCVYELVFSYAIPQIITGDYTAYIQESFNSSVKSPVDSKKMFSNQASYVVGARFNQIRHNRFPEYSVECFQDLVRPSDVNSILNFYRINRGTPFQLNISNSKIFGWSGVVDVILSDLDFEREANGFYRINYKITIK